MARPTELTPELAEELCRRVEEGEVLGRICAPEDMPARSTVYRWLSNEGNEWFAGMYAHAREVRAEKIFDEMFEIADDGSNDFMTITKGDDTYNVEDREVTARSKLRVDTRKWALSKMLPKKYGEKLDLTSDGKAMQPITGMVIRTEEKNED